MLPDVTDFCRIFLLRHPELAAESASLAIGDGDAHLSRRGEATLIEWMKLFAPIDVHRVASPEQRQSRDAATAIAATKGLEVVLDERLRDQHMGEWQGRPWEELAQQDPNRVQDFFADFGEVAAPGGESLGQSVERFLSWWSEQQAELVGKTLLVVSSGAMVTGFAAAMLGMRLSRAVSLNLPHGGFGALDVFANGARIATWNATALTSE